MNCPSRLLGVLGASVLLGLGAFVSSAPAAAPAWQPVGATGPTVIPPRQSEVQRVFVDAEGGTFTLTARHLAAEGLGDLANNTTVANLITTSGAFAAGQRLEGLGILPGTNITATGPSTLSISSQPQGGGKQTVLTAYDVPGTTAPIPYNATAAEVQAALEGVASVGAGNVEVSGGPGNHNAEHPYTVSFEGALAGTDVALLEPNSGALAGNATAMSTTFGGRGTSKLALMAQNIGGATSSGTITFRATLPSGITALGPPTMGGESVAWSCGTSTASEILCTRNDTVRPSLTVPPINAIITAAPGVEGGVVQMEVSGGGAVTASEELPLTVSSTPAKPGFQTFVAGAYDENGVFDQRAGGHPFSASTAIFANTVRSVKGYVVPAGDFKDITVKLPPGFLGNPIAVPECPESTPTRDCDLDTMVAVVEPVLESFGGQGTPTGVFNTQAPFGYPAKFRFRVFESEDLNVVGSLRSDEDYGLDAASPRTPQIAQVFGAFFTFWGEPASSAFARLRCKGPAGIAGIFAIKNEVGCRESGAAHTAFLTSATNCAEQALHPPTVPVTATLWQNPGEIFETAFGIEPVTGCENLEFSADFTFEPSETRSDSPASFRTSLTVPSEGLTDPTKPTTPEIRKTVVQLPEGVVLNASGADGLQACSEAQIGLKNKIDPATGLPEPEPMPNPLRFNKNPNTCPEAAKIGTGELKSALLTDPLHGALYLAAQGDGNPFGSLFAIYLVIEDPRHGIFIKLPGRVDPDPMTGQMEVTFENLPQLPFTSLDLDLKGGSRSPLASPSTCGSFVTTATNTPWSAPESGPPAVSANGFEINQGPGGGPCAKTPEERPFDIGWKAGAEGTQAGASGPFDFQITRPDGSQELDTLELGTPPGLSASLKGVPSCSDAQIKAAEANTGRQEQANPACPAASQIGRLEVGSGSGPTPFYTPGKLYLAGPYKGAPLSVVSITPAVAGPFDLGNVVSRNAVFIDRSTAQVTAKTDPIPQILKGVVLRIRDVRIFLDHKDWTINPTSCEPLSVNLTAHGNSGALANKTARFQVGGCKDLAFKPKLSAKVSGGTKRGDHPAFTATLTYPPGAGYANIKDVQVALPHSEFLEQSHINTICTRPQAAAHACPPGSIYGYAEATTPLLDGKLTGPVFLKSSDHQLPDLAIALRGPDNQPVEVEFQGRIDSVKGQIRNTIEGLPDVPVSSFTLKMKGGNKGLLVNSRNLCASKAARMTVHMVAQNNERSDARPQLQNSCGPKSKKGKHKHQQRHGRLLSGLIAGW
jgi:hypothetical protein